MQHGVVVVGLQPLEVGDGFVFPVASKVVGEHRLAPVFLGGLEFDRLGLGGCLRDGLERCGGGRTFDRRLTFMIVSRMKKNVLAGKGLVKKSAMFSVVATYGTRSRPSSTHSRMKKCRRAMCFVFGWCSGL